MIKINVISNNAGWTKYLKRPDIYIEKRIKNLNEKNGKYKKKIFTVLYYFQEVLK